MTSAELKHRVKLQEWAARIQDCRSSGQSVRAGKKKSTQQPIAVGSVSC